MQVSVTIYPSRNIFIHFTGTTYFVFRFFMHIQQKEKIMSSKLYYARYAIMVYSVVFQKELALSQ